MNMLRVFRSPPGRCLAGNEKTKKQGGAWTAISFYWAFFFVPCADFVVGVDTFNKRDNEYKILRDR